MDIETGFFGESKHGLLELPIHDHCFQEISVGRIGLLCA